MISFKDKYPVRLPSDTQSIQKDGRRGFQWLGAVLGLCFVALSCGGTDDSSNNWQLDEQQAPAIVAGTYDVELEVIEDGCDPSLHDVTRFEDWLPKKVPVRIAPGPNPSVSFEIYRLRAGAVHHASALLDEDFKPVTTQLEELIIPTPMHECEGSRTEDDEFRLRVEALAITERVIELRYETDWANLEQCRPADIRFNAAWSPSADCREEYRVTYRLSETCPDSCELLAPGHTLVEGDGYSYFRTRRDEFCVCEE